MLRVIIQSFDELGKRVADAVAADPSMTVTGIIDPDPARLALAIDLGFDAIAADTSLPEADVLLADDGIPTPPGLPLVFRPGSCRPGAPQPDSVVPPSADVIVLMRLLEATGGSSSWHRLDCTSAGCHDEAVPPGGSPDRLEPLFPGPPPALAQSLGLSPSNFTLHRVHVPCGGSRVYYVHLEAHRAPDLERLAAGLASAPEYFRDLGRRRGDHHEVFIWQESLTVSGNHVYLLAEADPVAVVIPEILDALRNVAGPESRKGVSS
jgi:hypothetical protein